MQRLYRIHPVLGITCSSTLVVGMAIAIACGAGWLTSDDQTSDDQTSDDQTSDDQTSDDQKSVATSASENAPVLRSSDNLSLSSIDGFAMVELVSYQVGQNQDTQNQDPSIGQPLSTVNEGQDTGYVEVDSAELARRQKAFDDKLLEWKQTIKDLLRIKLEYTICSPSEVDGLVLDWEREAAKGKEQIQELKVIALELFKAKPEVDRAIGVFLSHMVEQDARSDRYESAYQIAMTLVNRDVPSARLLWRFIGVACFSTHRFDEAEVWLSRAQEFEGEDERTANLLEACVSYRELWPREEQLRERDAQLGDLPRVKIETTQGEMVVELFEEEAPNTVANFVQLVESGFYDGLKFHRVLPGFMAQTGCPHGTGYGHPGYFIPCECHGDSTLRHHFGATLSMAHSGERDSGGSQFFITFGPSPHLDGVHTAFGRVIEGIEVLAKIQRIDPDDPEAAPIEPDQIIKATVIRKRDHTYEPIKISPDPSP